MTATATISYKGNLALETYTFTIPLAAAFKAVELVGAKPGSYWESNLLKPARRAKRAKADVVKVYTAGFGASELSNVLFNVGCQVDYLN